MRMLQLQRWLLHWNSCNSPEWASWSCLEHGVGWVRFPPACVELTHRRWPGLATKLPNCRCFPEPPGSTGWRLLCAQCILKWRGREGEKGRLSLWLLLSLWLYIFIFTLFLCFVHYGCYYFLLLLTSPFYKHDTW